MFDVQNLPLQADQARAARNYFGLSQAKAAEASDQHQGAPAAGRRHGHGPALRAARGRGRSSRPIARQS